MRKSDEGRRVRAWVKIAENGYDLEERVGVVRSALSSQFTMVEPETGTEPGRQHWVSYSDKWGFDG